MAHQPICGGRGARGPRDELTAAQGGRSESLLLGQPGAPGRSGAAIRLCGPAVRWGGCVRAPPGPPGRRATGSGRRYPSVSPAGPTRAGGRGGWIPCRRSATMPLSGSPAPSGARRSRRPPATGGGPGAGAGACPRRPADPHPPRRRPPRAPAPGVPLARTGRRCATGPGGEDGGGPAPLGAGRRR